MKQSTTLFPIILNVFRGSMRQFTGTRKLYAHLPSHNIKPANLNSKLMGFLEDTIFSSSSQDFITILEQISLCLQGMDWDIVITQRK